MRPGSISRRPSAARRARVALVFALVFGLALEAGAQPAAAQREFAVSRDPERVVLRYTEHPGELAGHLPALELEVRGNGRARVRVPAYRKGAGAYEVDLGEQGLEALVSALVGDGVADFDADDVRRRRREVARGRRAEPGALLHFRSDETQIALDLELERYRGARPGASMRRDFQKQLRYRGLRADARRFREIEALQGLARAQGRLRALIADARARGGGPP